MCEWGYDHTFWSILVIPYINVHFYKSISLDVRRIDFQSFNTVISALLIINYRSEKSNKSTSAICRNRKTIFYIPRFILKIERKKLPDFYFKKLDYYPPQRGLGLLHTSKILCGLYNRNHLYTNKTSIIHFGTLGWPFPGYLSFRWTYCQLVSRTANKGILFHQHITSSSLN